MPTISRGYDAQFQRYMAMVFGHMSAGLALTGVVSYGVSLFPQLMTAIYGTPLFLVVLLAPLFLSFYLGRNWMNLKYETVQALFFLYATLLGIMLSSIFIVYPTANIAKAFFTTAGTFGTMSLWGYYTQRDLTGMGSFLSMGLIGLIIAMIVNMFVRSAGFDMGLSILGVLIFTGLTAYDVQRLKNIYYQIGDRTLIENVSIVGALILYLDFINIFLFLLRLMGSNRNSN